jgi:DNA-binding HxlR family transcriptional regulator
MQIADVQAPQQRNEVDPCASGDVRSSTSRAPAYLCAVEEAARIVGQKWTLQIVNVLIDFHESRFCELQDALGGVNPSTLSARLKMLEEQGLVQREQVSTVPPHVIYRLTPMGEHLSGAIRELTHWSRVWLCEQRPAFPSTLHGEGAN